MNHSKTGIRHLAKICVKKGVAHIVISPGSRNAPIILAFQQQKGIEMLSIADERSAGFFALGMAQQTKKPVAIACTSGSAALNYAPAIAEAYYQKIPLLVLTADRPNEWIDMADSQTIRQKNVFENYIRKSVELPQNINSDDDIWYANRLINEALNACTYPVPGPVHINLPFAEPLYEGYDETLPEPKLIETIIAERKIPESEINALAKQWKQAKKKLILTGMLEKNEGLNSVLKEIAADPSVAVLTETTSNLYSEGFHSCIDRIISSMQPEDIENFQPDLLITLGNQVISKKVKAFLRQHKANTHWHIDAADLNLDTYQSLTQNILLHPLDFFNQIKAELKILKSDYSQIWENADEQTEQKHQEFLKNCPYSDLKVFETLLDKIPHGSHLQLANSTPVRYAQLFQNRKDLHYFSNRGTSGIDGCVSTAAGAAYASNHPTTLITGDLAFFYDSNGLWNNYLNKNLKIILINNNGGGIFRFIDGPMNTNSLEYFETPHNLKADHIAKTFDLDYFEASSLEELTVSLEAFYKHDKACILEIFTPQKENAEILKDYFKYLKSK